jgi:hypothetical protein
MDRSMDRSGRGLGSFYGRFPEFDEDGHRPSKSSRKSRFGHEGGGGSAAERRGSSARSRSERLGGSADDNQDESGRRWDESEANSRGTERPYTADSASDSAGGGVHLGFPALRLPGR